MKKIVVAIDGPAGSGKSSVSSQVAQRLGIKYIDSGALYRSITWFILDKHHKIPAENIFLKDLEDIKMQQFFNPDASIQSYVNGQEISSLIRDEKITKNIKLVCDAKEVRDFVNDNLRKWSKQESIIMDGRDIGSVVFPQADLKIYLDASLGVRAARRASEYLLMGKKVDKEAIKEQIKIRDNQYQTRKYGALQKLPEAIYLDTSDLDFEQVISQVIRLVEGILAKIKEDKKN